MIRRSKPLLPSCRDRFGRLPEEVEQLIQDCRHQGALRRANIEKVEAGRWGL